MSHLKRLQNEYMEGLRAIERQSPRPSLASIVGQSLSVLFNVIVGDVLDLRARIQAQAAELGELNKEIARLRGLVGEEVEIDGD